MNRCAHSVYIVPEDWQAQSVWKIPPAKRISWFCWWCRDPDFCAAQEFTPEKLLELALANCETKAGKAGPIRKTDLILIENADYNEDADGEDIPASELLDAA